MHYRGSLFFLNFLLKTFYVYFSKIFKCLLYLLLYIYIFENKSPKILHTQKMLVEVFSMEYQMGHTKSLYLVLHLRIVFFGLTFKMFLAFWL
jgi:hypothetical protein